MPVITINKIADRTKTSQKGKKYQVVSVEGTKYGTDEEWSTDIFKNDVDVLEQLEEFGPGDTANFKFKKNGNFWDLKTIEEPTEENLEYQASAPKKQSTGGNSGGGGNSTPDSVKVGMSIHNAIAAASRVCKTGTKAGDLIEYAEKLLPFLMLTKLPTSDADDNPFVDPEDALDPPTDD